MIIFIKHHITDDFNGNAIAVTGSPPCVVRLCG